MIFTLQCIDDWICVAQSYVLLLFATMYLLMGVFIIFFWVSAAEGELFHNFHFDTLRLGLGMAASGSSL